MPPRSHKSQLNMESVEGRGAAHLQEQRSKMQDPHPRCNMQVLEADLRSLDKHVALGTGNGRLPCDRADQLLHVAGYAAHVMLSICDRSAGTRSGRLCASRD